MFREIEELSQGETPLSGKALAGARENTRQQKPKRPQPF